MTAVSGTHVLVFGGNLLEDVVPVLIAYRLIPNKAATATAAVSTRKMDGVNEMVFQPVCLAVEISSSVNEELCLRSRSPNSSASMLR